MNNDHSVLRLNNLFTIVLRKWAISFGCIKSKLLHFLRRTLTFRITIYGNHCMYIHSCPFSHIGENANKRCVTFNIYARSFDVTARVARDIDHLSESACQDVVLDNEDDQAAIMKLTQTEVCVCVCACVRACVRVCVRACLCAFLVIVKLINH